MKKLFYEDTHILDFEAKVMDCQPYKQGGFQVVLDQTAFFQEEGGQAAGEAYIQSHMDREGCMQLDEPLMQEILELFQRAM